MIFNSNKYKVILKPPAKNFSIYFTFGNSFRGDDGVGEYIYRNVKGNSEKYFIVYVGEKWDRIIYLSEKLKPEKIIIIDAANFKDKPGKIKVLPFEKIKSCFLSTHNFPLQVIHDFIKSEIHCKIFFVGIQVEKIEFGEKISDSVLSSAKKIIKILNKFNIRPYSA